MIALITGASAGFGAAIARKLAQEGHKVIVTARRKERLLALQQEIGENCLPLAFDITDEKATLQAIAELPEAWKAIDILVNNAGLALGIGAAQDSSLEDWKQMIATNITGLVTVTHAVLPGMVERNRGLIVNLGSIAGTYPYPGGNVYGGTKAFVKQFSLNYVQIWLEPQFVYPILNLVFVVALNFQMFVSTAMMPKQRHFMQMWITLHQKILPILLLGLHNVRHI